MSQKSFRMTQKDPIVIVQIEKVIPNSPMRNQFALMSKIQFCRNFIGGPGMKQDLMIVAGSRERRCNIVRTKIKQELNEFPSNRLNLSKS